MHRKWRVLKLWLLVGAILAGGCGFLQDSQPRSGEKGWLGFASVSPDRQITIRVWETETSTLAEVLEGDNVTSVVRSDAFGGLGEAVWSNDSKQAGLLLCAGSEGRIWTYDTDAGQLVQSEAFGEHIREAIEARYRPTREMLRFFEDDPIAWACGPGTSSYLIFDAMLGPARELPPP